MALFLIGVILIAAAYVFFYMQLKKFALDNDKKTTSKKVEGNTRIIFVATALGIGILNILSSCGLVLLNHWTLKAFEWIFLIFGSLIFGAGIAIAVGGFYLNYWCLNLDSKQKKICEKCMVFSAIIGLIGLWIFSEGIANQDIYPLVNRIDFKHGLIAYTTTHRTVTPGFGIMFYGILIVCGALICYFITDHETYKKFGEHGLIDTLFVVSFLGGIIGARLWYCLILEPEMYLADPASILAIFDGGLAIQGGALFGFAVGVGFVLLFRKYIDVRFLMDVAVPTILIAQAVGRWGNFFNQEVYGNVAPEWLVNILPTIIKKNMYIFGEYRVPLFLIESIINLGGYFLIRFLSLKVFKFGYGKGYQSAMYISWYGLVRFALEPLREGFDLHALGSTANADKFGYLQSWIVAGAMILLGIVLFVVLWLIHKYRFEKGLEDELGNKIKKA